MKKQHILLLSLVLLTCQPLCLAGGGKKGDKSYRNRPTVDEDNYVYLVNQAKITTDFVDVTKNDATPSLATETPKKEAQFAPGTFYQEIKKWIFRDVRGLAEKTIAMFETDKKDNKVLGTGDREENTVFFSEALKSYVHHNELDKAKYIVTFTDLHKMPLTKDVLASAATFFESHATALQQEHESLAPQVAKDKDVRNKQVAIAATLERLKGNIPEAK